MADPTGDNQVPNVPSDSPPDQTAEAPPMLTERERRMGMAGLASRFWPQNLHFSGENGESVRGFADAANLHGNLMMAGYEGVTEMAVMHELLASSLLKGRALRWWETNKSTFVNNTWDDILAALIGAFLDPLEKQRVAEEFATITQSYKEEVRDYIGRMKDLLNRATQTGYAYTSDTVWSTFTRGLNARFRQALSGLDLLGSRDDGWSRGAESLARWELRNPAAKIIVDSQPAKNTLSTLTNKGHPASHSNTNRMSSSNKKNYRWSNTKSGHGGATFSAQASAGGGGKAGGSSVSVASSAAKGDEDQREVGKKCYACGEIGHMAYRCPKKPKNQPRAQGIE